MNTVFLRWERPLGLEVSLSHSSPLPQASQGSLAQALHASVENHHDGAAVPRAVRGGSRGRRPQDAGAATLESPTAQCRKDLVAAAGSLRHPWSQGDLQGALREQRQMCVASPKSPSAWDYLPP